MPHLSEAVKKRLRDRAVEQALEILNEFKDCAAWQRSKKGNLWRKWDNLTLTVFRRGSCYAWSMADGDEVTYSPRSYPNAEQALDGLASALDLYEI